MKDELKNFPPFALKEAHEKGLTRRMIAYYLKEGVIERVARGIYQGVNYNFSGNVLFEELAIVANKYSSSVVCLISALNYYELTDEMMHDFWLAIPFGTGPYTCEGTRFVRFRNMDLGRTEIREGDISFKIFDRERTIVDCFKCLDLDLSLSTLKRYLKGGEDWRPNIDKLNQYAKILRTPIHHYIEAMLV